MAKDYVYDIVLIVLFSIGAIHLVNHTLSTYNVTNGCN